MICSIGVLLSRDINKYNKFVDIGGKESQKYMIPNSNIELAQTSENIFETEITKDEIVLYAVIADELNQVAVFVSNGEEVYCHHDIFMLNTCIRGNLIKMFNKEFISVITFEKDVMVFDPFVEYAPYPNCILTGHKNELTCQQVFNNKLYTSDLTEIIEWNLETLKPNIIYNFNTEIFNFLLFFDTSSNMNAIIVNNDTILIFYKMNKTNLKTITVDESIENIKVYNEKLYVVDIIGSIYVIDLSTLTIQLKKKIHDDVIFQIEIVNDKIITISSDKYYKILDNNLNILYTESLETIPTVFTIINFNSNIYMFIGNINNSIKAYNVTNILKQ